MTVAYFDCFAGAGGDMIVGALLDAGADLQVIVDDWNASEAVAALARIRGHEVAVERQDDGAYRVIIGDQGRASAGDTEEMLEPVTSTAPDPTRTVLFIGSDELGRGDGELGRTLMLGFLRNVVDAEPWPWRVALINRGVFLATVDEEAADVLELMTAAGVEVLSCQTCLEHYKLTDKLRAGRSTTMPEIVDSLNEAAKVIRV